MKLKVNSEALLTTGLIGGLGLAAWFWWQSMQSGNPLSITRLIPADYAYSNAPGGTIVGDVFVTPGGGAIRPLPQTLTPNTNPAGM
jgi:hypothetical protein